MFSIKNVTVAGASGSLGRPILNALLASGAFNIQVLRHQGSTSTFPPGVTVVDVDYESLESLTATLHNQHAVVSAISGSQIHLQNTLVDAALAARVQRFIPSDFGSNLDVPATRTLPVFKTKVDVQDYLKEKTRDGPMSYTFVYNGAFLDWGVQMGFLLNTKESKPMIINGGDATFSATNLASIGKAVVGVLQHPAETKNRVVYIEDTKISQNKLLEIAKSVDPQSTREPVHVQLDDMVKKADERLAKGIVDMETLTPYLFRAIMDPACGGNFEKTDNELLGLKGVSQEEVVEIVKSAMGSQ